MTTTLHFQRYGHGPQVILAFHGYGQGHGHWRSMATVLGEAHVTIYAFDLFYHGQSRLSKADAPLTKERLGDLLAQFLREQQIDKFGLLAFSMGAKFALTALERFAGRVEQFWLIAPDGLQRQFWYALATTPPLMRGLFARTVLHPQRLLRFINSLQQRRLVNANLARFAEWQLDSREKRLRIYRSWVGFRKLTFSLRHLARVLNQHAIPVTFFLGRHDPVIPHAGLQPFIASLAHAHTVLLDTGHAGLIYEVATYLRRHPEVQWKAA